MNQEQFNDYLENRYYNQIEWYDKKASYNQKIFKTLQLIVTALAVVTPILLVVQEELLLWIAVLTSATVAISATLLRTFNYHENWLNYRSTCEMLKKEIYYYKAKLHDYHDATDPEALFVERVEDLISREQTFWCGTQKLDERDS